MRISRDSTVPSPRHAISAALFFALLFVILLAVSYSVYHRLVANEERQFEETLNRVADIQTTAVSNWVLERLGDATVFSSGRFLGETMNAWIARGMPNDDTRRQVWEQLEAIRATFSYVDASILDASGKTLISTRKEPVLLDPVTDEVFWHAISTNGAQISSIHSTAAAAHADRVIDIVAPLLSANRDGKKASSFLFLSANANLPLDPLVQPLPVLNTSADVVLAEIQDGQVITIAAGGETSRFHFHDPLPLPPAQLVSLADTAPSHFLMQQEQGAMLAVARKIYGTQWYLVTMAAEDAIQENVRGMAWIVTGIAAAVLGILGMLVLAWWRKKESDMRLQAVQTMAEKQLLQRQYDYLSKYANDMIILADAGGNILDINDKTSQLLGYGREQLIGMPIDTVFHRSCHILLHAILNKLRHQGTALFELTQQRADGTAVPAEVNARLIRLDGKQFMQLISRDITERRQSEAALQESQDKLNAILSSIQDVVWSFSPGLERVNYINRSVEHLCGYPAPEFENNPRLWLDVIHPEDRPKIMQALQQMGSEHSSCDAEFRIVRRDGEVRWVHCRGHMVAGDNGEPLRIDGVTSDITLRKSAEQQVQTLAYYDNVTTLPNRTLLNDRLAQATHIAQRNQKKVAVLFMDLDNFKHVNDSLGHQVGDLLLRTIAERLLQCVREEDTVSRIGGDEFVVVLSDIDRGAQAVAVAEKILAITAQPFSLQAQQIHTTISIGISVYPDDGTDPHELIKHADAALYQAKSHGRNNYQFFTQELNRQITRSSSIERQLRHALGADELSLWYQPQIDARSGRLVGAEALLRWRQDGSGFLSPAEFIPVAEERGLIGQIGEWTLREACRQGCEWQAEGLRALPVAVNISPLQFQQKDFAAFITRLLDETRLEPARLELEITESSIMRRASQVAELAARLRDTGVKISIDDFGTGYSSLSYLKQIPIDKIKIDRSFIANMLDDPDDEAITCAIINLAHSLKLKVIAEGVESEAQLACLRRFGCNEVQGFYYSAAVSADTLHDMLANDKIFA